MLVLKIKTLFLLQKIFIFVVYSFIQRHMLRDLVILTVYGLYISHAILYQYKDLNLKRLVSDGF